MGGVAIVGAAFLGYLAAHINSEAIKFADTAIALWVLDPRPVRGRLRRRLPRRPPGAEPRTPQAGQDARDPDRGDDVRHHGHGVGEREHAPLVHPPARHRSRDRRLDHLVRRGGLRDDERGEHHRRARRSGRRIRRARVRGVRRDLVHPVPSPRPRIDLGAAGSIDVAVVAAAMLGALRRVPLVERAAGEGLHGRHRRARHRRRDGRAWGCSRTPHLLLPIIGGLYVVETASVIAQVISFRGFGRRILRMSPIHHHFELLGWPESTIIVRFWILGGSRDGPRARAVLRRLPPDSRSDRVVRVLVVGLRATGAAVVAWLAARGDDVTVVEESPGQPGYADRRGRCRVRRCNGDRGRAGLGRRWSRRPTWWSRVPGSVRRIRCWSAARRGRRAGARAIWTSRSRPRPSRSSWSPGPTASRR